MKKHPKNIRRICLVSSAAFSAASGIYGWAAPIGAALGLAVNMTESEKRDNQIEFEEAVDRALEKTKEAMYSDSKKEILKELCQLEIEIDSLTEIIKIQKRIGCGTVLKLMQKKLLKYLKCISVRRLPKEIL